MHIKAKDGILLNTNYSESEVKSSSNLNAQTFLKKDVLVFVHQMADQMYESYFILIQFDIAQAILEQKYYEEAICFRNPAFEI